MATTIPIQARIMEKVLTIPPRMLGANESSKPKTPKTIAITAKRKPLPGLTKKLAMAAAIAINDGILKCGLTSAVCMSAY